MDERTARIVVLVADHRREIGLRRTDAEHVEVTRASLAEPLEQRDAIRSLGGDGHKTPGISVQLCHGVEVRPLVVENSQLGSLGVSYNGKRITRSLHPVGYDIHGDNLASLGFERVDINIPG